MSTHVKLIIPLIDDSITLEDISTSNGFVNGYLRDKNKPYIENCIFLLYDPRINNAKTHARDYKFTTLPAFYNKEAIRINGMYYNMYVFKITNSDVKRFLQGFRHEYVKTFTRICLFWKGSDEMVSKYLSDTLPSFECNWEEVPEEDSYTTVNNKQENPGGLVISPWVFCCY